MNQLACATISVQGNAVVHQRPSYLVLLGKIQVSEATLELALTKLNQKRDAVSRCLEKLATQNLQFGEPRFPEQVEPDPMRMAKRMAQIRRRLSDPQPETDGKRSVLVSYSAQWPISDMSSDDMLVFVDRLQFEMADLPKIEEPPKERPRYWESDSMTELQSLMTEVTPPEGDEIHFLFLSSLTDSLYEKALTEAFRDGQSKAAMTARAVDKELGDLYSAHWSMSAKESHGVPDMYRRMYLPILAESPLHTGPNEAIHESPRTADFVVTVHLTFGLK